MNKMTQIGQLEELKAKIQATRQRNLENFRALQTKVISIESRKQHQPTTQPKKKRKLQMQRPPHTQQQQCLEFRVFGKCTKHCQNKCSKLHDKSLICVCPSFAIYGACRNSKCALQHKLIPALMPVCRSFLIGNCRRDTCPFKHVNVGTTNPCEDFLNGICKNGDNCKLLHSYICPDFASHQSCPRGNKCLMLHLKKHTTEKEEGYYEEQQQQEIIEVTQHQQQKHQQPQNEDIKWVIVADL